MTIKWFSIHCTDQVIHPGVYTLYSCFFFVYLVAVCSVCIDVQYRWGYEACYRNVIFSELTLTCSHLFKKIKQDNGFFVLAFAQKHIIIYWCDYLFVIHLVLVSFSTEFLLHCCFCIYEILKFWGIGGQWLSYSSPGCKQYLEFVA